MADIKIRWTLDVVSRGAGAKVLKEDRAIRAGLIQTDAQYRKTAATAASVSARQAQAASRVATSTRESTSSQVAASEEVARYAAAQRKVLSISTRMIEQQDALGAAYVRSGRAARGSAADQSLAARVRSKVSGAGGAVLGAGAAVGGAIRKAASTAGIGIGLAGFAGLAVVAKETIGFDRALRNVNSIAQLSETRLAAVGKRVRELAGKTAQAPITLAKGMYDLVSSGFSAKNSLTIVGAAARAATAGLSTTDVSTKAIAAVLNAYHQSASKAKAISDTLFQTVNYGVITFGELAEHIGTLLPFSASLGVSLKEDGAAISTLTKQGIRGELAITFLKNAMVAFLKPSKGMADALKKTGFSSGEALIKAKGFEGGLSAIIKTTDGTKASIAKLFPNIRSLTAVFGLTGKNTKSAAKDLAGFKNDAGATSKALSQQSQSISYGWNKLKAQASSLAIGLGQKLVPAANEVLGVLTKIGDKKTVLGGAVSSVLGGISAGITGQRTPAPLTTPVVPLRSPALPGPLTSSRQHPFEESSLQTRAQAVTVGEPSTLSKVGAAIGKAARTVGTAAVEAGKQLLEAFKPALPFLQNILLPLLLGIGKGVLGSVVGAFKILIPVIKGVSTVLGAVGKVAAPFKSVFEGIGTVIGFVASGPILKALGGLGKIGIVFRVLGAPVRAVGVVFGLLGRGILGALKLFARIDPAVVAVRLAISRVPLVISSVVGRAARAAKTVAGAIVSAFNVVRSVPGRVIGAIGGIAGRIAKISTTLASIFFSFGKSMVSSIAGGVSSTIGSIAGIFAGLKPKFDVSVNPLHPHFHLSLGGHRVFRRGGRVNGYQSGGMVDALVSPGEAIVYGNSTWTVPGPRMAADSVFTTLPVGAAVLTADGQARMGAGASLGEAIATQAPHFRQGGVVTGKVSTFGPPSEPRGTTASGVSSASRGIAVRPGATWQSGKATLGQYWQVSIAGHSGVLKQIDLGPNQSTGRRIDVTGAGAKYLGIDPAHFPTNSTGTATLLGKSRKGGSASGGVSINLPIHLGRSRTRAGLVSDALSQGVEAGAAGLTRTEINRAYRGARGAETNPILAAIQQAQTATTRKITIGGSKKSGSGGLVRPAAKWNPRHLPIASWIAPFLSWGAGHGWGGSATSGWRSRAEQARIYASGIRPAAKPGTSNHEGKTFPSGAVDVTAAAQLSGVLSKRPGPHLLQWAGSKDPVHFSYPHNGGYRRGGIVGFRKGGMTVPVARRSTVSKSERALYERLPPQPTAAQATRVRQLASGAFSALSGKGAWPAWATARPIKMPKGPRGWGSAAWEENGTVNLPWNFVYWLTHPSGPQTNQALAALVHEPVHAFQKGSLKRWEAEGGAVAFTRMWAPQVLPTTVPVSPTYRSFYSAVNATRGRNWVLHGQWANSARQAGKVGANFRRGGIIGRLQRFRKGGAISAPGAGHALNAGLTRALAFVGGSFDALDETIGKAAEQRIEALRAAVSSRVKAGGDKKTIQRLESILSLIDLNIGLRIGAYTPLIAKRSASLEHSQNILDRSLRKSGIEPESVAGLTVQIGADQHATGAREANVTAAKHALALAKKTGSRQQITAATEQLTQAQEDLDEAITKGIEDRRSILIRGAQDASDTAQFGVETVQNALSGLDIAQRLNRTSETPGGEVQKARAIQSQLLPALQNNLAALNSQLGTFQSIGDTSGARQTLLSIQSAGNEIASAMAESADLIRQAAEQSAQETVDRAAHGTSLAQLGEQRLELEERIAGTFDAGGQERANYIDQQLIPALNTELAALNAQLGTASKEGDATLASQIAEAIATKQNDILQATLDATEQVAQNTNKRQVGGTLGFAYGGESLSDSIIAVGNGS